jgi:hypothetical protein
VFFILLIVSSAKISPLDLMAFFTIGSFYLPVRGDWRPDFHQRPSPQHKRGKSSVNVDAAGREPAEASSSEHAQNFEVRDRIVRKIFGRRLIGAICGAHDTIRALHSTLRENRAEAD